MGAAWRERGRGLRVARMTDGYFERLRSERERMRERLTEMEQARSCSRETLDDDLLTPLQQTRAELARLTALVAKIEPWHVQ